MPRRSRTKHLFSYGSNNPEQLSERLEYSVRGAQGAYADGWQRVFRGYSRNWGGGVASLLRKSGSTTYGYVAPVTAEDLDILDRYEGVRSGNYKRQQITVTTADGEEIRAVAYISRSREFNEPTKAYLRATAKTIGQFWSGSGGPVKVSDIPIRNPERTGKLGNPLTPKHVLVRAGSESELIELIPIAEDALLALGATDVMVQPIQNIHAGEYTALFIVEGLGGGKRWSSPQKKQFRKRVSDSLPSQIREPNFQNASSVLDPRDLEGVEASLYAREYGVGMKTPDSDRTRRAKARSKARRKLTRRPNSKSRR